MKVALAQIDATPGDLDGNLEKHLENIQAAITEHAELIVFPELSLAGDMIGPDAPDVSLPGDDNRLGQLLEQSQKIDIVFGLVERGRRSLYNRYNAAFYFSRGTLIYRHRKLFLVNYAVFEEAKHYVPGNNLQAFDTRLGRSAMLICNDAWHAASPYVAALDGAELLIVPADSARGTLAGHMDIQSAWEHMNRAYSAMMGFYTIFVNRVGMRVDKHGEFRYWGGSEIIDPQGEEVVKAPYDEEALVFGEIETERVAQQRFKAPFLRDARLWIFRQEINRLAAKRTEQLNGDAGAEVLETDRPEAIV